MKTLSSLVFALTSPVALFAYPPISTGPLAENDIEIISKIWMTVRTMRLSCMILPGISSSYINHPCYWFQMARVYAISIATKMIYNQVFWNFPNIKLISHAMRQLTHSRCLMHSIASRISGGYPYPARISIVGLITRYSILLTESFDRSNIDGHPLIIALIFT